MTINQPPIQSDITAKITDTSDIDTPANKVTMGKLLSQEELMKVRKLVTDFAKCFSSKEQPLGHAKGIYHRVSPECKAFKMKMKALSPTMLGEQATQVTNMIEHDRT